MIKFNNSFFILTVGLILLSLPSESQAARIGVTVSALSATTVEPDVLIPLLATTLNDEGGNDVTGTEIQVSDGDRGGIFTGGTTLGVCGDEIGSNTQYIGIRSGSDKKGFCYKNSVDGNYTISVQLTVDGILVGDAAQIEVVVSTKRENSVIITQPEIDGESIQGELEGFYDFFANITLPDGSNEDIFWQITIGNCVDKGEVVAGNEEPFFGLFDLLPQEAEGGYLFGTQVDMTTWDIGPYCFLVGIYDDVYDDIDFILSVSWQEEVSFPVFGTKWNDFNNDGVWDKEEKGVSGWLITATTLDYSTTTLTDINGDFGFVLGEGEWQVTEESRDNWKQTAVIQSDEVADDDKCTFIFTIDDNNLRRFDSCVFGNHFADIQEDDTKSSSGTRTNRFNSPAPQVLGASKTNVCKPYLTEYMSMEKGGSFFEVIKLQIFLGWKGYLVFLTGVFDSSTDLAVKAFQSDNYESVLQPWASLYSLDNMAPTGYIFKTTRWKINDIVCPNITPFPTLP